MKKRDDTVRNELEALAPRLARLKDERPDDGFVPPSGYFSGLADEVQERIRRQAAGEPTRIPRFRRPAIRRLLRAAAVALLLVAGAYWWLTPSGQDEPPAAALTADEIADYVNQNLTEFDEELVIEATGDADAEWLLLPTPGDDDAELNDYYEQLLRELDETQLEDLL